MQESGDAKEREIVGAGKCFFVWGLSVIRDWTAYSDVSDFKRRSAEIRS